MGGVTFAIACALVGGACTAGASLDQELSEALAAADGDDTTTTEARASDEPTADSDVAITYENTAITYRGAAPVFVRRLEDVAGDGELVPLDPGLYTGELLDGLVVSVPIDVGVYFDADNPPQAYGFVGGDGEAMVLPITGVVPADRVGSPIATQELDAVLTAVPDDIGTYFDAIPQLGVLNGGTTDTYRWWDIRVRPDRGDTHTECMAPPGRGECVSLFGEPTGAVTLDVMTDWKPRVVQPIAKPSILLWAAGQDGTVGPGHELALTLAQGFE